ncbi:ABC transporter ATP-binding protein [Streptomyces sp. NPDC050625]|uniref:ABC transporter ATP-binding protein n=1 Tax=Streptomyces sp. NPDC050625 TaxID=3154629 RepID=UPI0034412989
MRIEIRDLSVAYAGRTVVAGPHLVAAAGQITGLVGPNGSGKSTLLRTVYRHLKPTAGRVLLGDRDIQEMPPIQTARHVAALPQERGSDFELTVRDVVAMDRTPHKRAFAGDDAADRRIVAKGGFVQDPEVRVLDEPTNHLDLRHQVELLALQRTERRTTLVSLHDLNAAAFVCDRLHVLDGGAVIASGAPREVVTPDLLAEVFGVRTAVIEHPLTRDPLIAFDHNTPVEKATAAQTPGHAAT